MQKVSEMLIAVGGDMLKKVDSLEEMQVHLELVRIAWNMSLYSKNTRKTKLRKFIDKQKPYAPNVEALNDLEQEFKRIFNQKDTLYSDVKIRVERAEAIETRTDDYIIRAYSTGSDEYA